MLPGCLSPRIAPRLIRLKEGPARARQSAFGTIEVHPYSQWITRTLGCLDAQEETLAVAQPVSGGECFALLRFLH